MLPVERHQRDLPLEVARMINAAQQGAQPRPKAGARDERTLLGVGCSGLILIEAPSSAYHGGMLALEDNHWLRRRRPQAILHHTAPILPRPRSAC